MTFPMIKNTLKATLAAVAIAASSLFLPSTAQAEAYANYLYSTDATVIAIFVHLPEEGDSVSDEIITFAINNGVAIWIDCGPGLIIENVNGMLVAVRG